jgi:spore coat protein A
MINRRKFLEAGAAVGVGTMLPLKIGRAAEQLSRAGTAAPGGGGISPTLTKFVDPLPLPPAYAPNAVINGVPFYEIPMKAFTQKLHRDLPPTYLWGYGGTFPSRSIIATVGQPIRIRWRNDLVLPDPKKGIVGDVHPLAASIDRVNVDGVAGNPDQRIATHLHGGHVPWQSDGGPKAWYTTGKKPIIADPAFFNGDTYDYPNNQPGTTLWFHDHAMGITRMTVMAGTAGFWILRDANEGVLNLPSGAFEIPLAIQDRTFNPDGSLFYPPAPLIPEFFGDTMLVNGKVWPFFNVEPRKYRFRILDGCNARFLRMQLVVANADGTLPSTRFWQNVPFVQIGAEGGFLPTPTAPFNTLLMGPAERADVIVDFSAFAGKNILLFNDAATPFGNTQDTRGSIPEVMLFRVASTVSAPDTSTIPTDFTSHGLYSVSDPIVAANTPTRVTTLDEITDSAGFLRQLINQYGYELDTFNGLPGVPVPPDTATLGTTEVWSLINTTVDVHPIHLHQTMFKVLSRQPFSVSQYQAKRVHGVPLDPTPFLKQDMLSGPAPNESGWKDTVKANPGEVTRIAMRWEDYTGHYVYHCHILEHEEHDMMRALDVLPAV